jgi:putative ABC transport system substrate-binding protein
MKRRQFITLLGGAAATPALLWPRALHAQSATKVPRIGYLSPGSASPGPMARHDEFERGLRELGYVEGKNIVIEYRFAQGKLDRLAELAAELVQLKVDVIVSVVTQASVAAKNATGTIPIVMVSVSDPLGSGLVSSLSRPGGNVTGTSSMTAEVEGKSLELLKLAVPKVSRVAVLWNPENAIAQALSLRETEIAARAMGVQLQTLGARSTDEFDRTFAAMIRERAEVLLVLADPILTLHQSRIIEFANKSRLAAMYGTREATAVGGLMSYGTNRAALFHRAAIYVDKILKGVKPADLPVEQPTKFEFVINFKTAKALGLIVPDKLLALADEVIE